MTDLSRVSTKKLLMTYLASAKEVALMELALQLGIERYQDRRNQWQLVSERLKRNQDIVIESQEEILRRNVPIDL